MENTNTELTQKDNLTINEAISKLKESKATMISWIVSVLVLGQLGIVMLCFSNKNNTLWENFLLNLMLGNFYLFGIAIAGTNIFSCIHEIIFKSNIEYKISKIIILVISLGIIIFMIIMAIGSIDIDKSMRYYIDNINLKDIVIQILLYLSSIGVSLYLLAIQCMELGSELSKYNECEKMKLKKIKTKK